MTRLKRLVAACVMAAVPMFTSPAAFAAQEAAQAKPDNIGFRGDIVYGSKDAPNELIEYGSFTCPHCGEFARDVFPVIKKEFIDTGKVRFIFRNMVRDQFDLAAAEASRCTTDMKAVKTMVEAFFQHQKDWITAENQYEAIAAIAAKSGVDKKAFAACLTSDDLAQHIVKMTMDGANKYKAKFVPTIVYNGKVIEKHDLESMKKLLGGAH